MRFIIFDLNAIEIIQGTLLYAHQAVILCRQKNSELMYKETDAIIKERLIRNDDGLLDVIVSIEDAAKMLGFINKMNKERGVEL